MTLLWVPFAWMVGINRKIVSVVDKDLKSASVYVTEMTPSMAPVKLLCVAENCPWQFQSNYKMAMGISAQLTSVQL